MGKSAGILAALLFGALIVVNPAMAQEKKPQAKKAQAAAGKPVVKEITKNDKVRVFEIQFKPGDEGPNVERPFRVVRALKGGTLQRNYPDGKKQTVEWKAGEVKLLGPDKPYVPKNIGKTTVHLYVVETK